MVSICIGVLCVHMFICVVYTQSTCPFQLHQASVGSRPILLFIACESCVIYCDRHPVFSKMVNSQYRDWIVEKFICICVKSAESKLTTHLFLLWVRPKKKICVFTVRRPTLIFGPDPKLFYVTFTRKLLKYPIFAYQCSFWCLNDHYCDKNKSNVTLEV